MTERSDIRNAMSTARFFEKLPAQLLDYLSTGVEEYAMQLAERSTPEDKASPILTDDVSPFIKELLVDRNQVCVVDTAGGLTFYRIKLERL